MLVRLVAGVLLHLFFNYIVEANDIKILANANKFCPWQAFPH